MKTSGNDSQIVMEASSDCDRLMLEAILDHQMNGGRMVIVTASTSIEIDSSGAGDVRMGFANSEPGVLQRILRWAMGAK